MNSEIGSITTFHSSYILAQYAGLTWRIGNSADFELENTSITKANNTYLRYSLGKVANSIRRHIPKYQIYYAKKYAELLRY